MNPSPSCKLKHLLSLEVDCSQGVHTHRVERWGSRRLSQRDLSRSCARRVARSANEGRFLICPHRLDLAWFDGRTRFVPPSRRLGGMGCRVGARSAGGARQRGRGGGRSPRAGALIRYKRLVNRARVLTDLDSSIYKGLRSDDIRVRRTFASAFDGRKHPYSTALSSAFDASCG